MVTLTCKYLFNEESTDLENMNEYQEARSAAEPISACVGCSQPQVDAYLVYYQAAVLSTLIAAHKCTNARFVCRYHRLGHERRPIQSRHDGE